MFTFHSTHYRFFRSSSTTQLEQHLSIPHKPTEQATEHSDTENTNTEDTNTEDTNTENTNTENANRDDTIIEDTNTEIKTTKTEENINACEVNGSRIVVEKLRDNGSDEKSKDYLTEDEALNFEPLTDVRNVVSMRQSILRMIGTIFLYQSTI